jgi:hypothetical protein
VDVLFLFPQKKKNQKSASQRTGCAFFGERSVLGLGYCYSEKVNAGLEK